MDTETLQLFSTQPSMLPTRFLFCCSQNLQKSTFDYTIPLFFFPKWATEVGSLFSTVKGPGSTLNFHWRGKGLHMGHHDFRVVTWHIQGIPFIRGKSNPMLGKPLSLNFFSEDYLCMNSFSCMDPSMQTTNFFSLNIFFSTQFNTCSKSGFLPWQVENIFSSKQTVSSSHAFWQLKLSARKVWSFSDAQFSEHNVKRA